MGKLLGYRVAVIDDRPQFASVSRFPGADRVICCGFSGILEHLAPGPATSVVIVTRGHQHDLDCLANVHRDRLQLGPKDPAVPRAVPR